jgi:hypothetical protein
MIRKVPILKPEIGLFKYKQIKYKIDNLEYMEPFVYAKCNEHIIYSVESLFKGKNENELAPKDYIYFSGYLGRPSFFSGCAGSFYNSLSIEEKNLFEKNLFEINKLLNIL